MKKKAWNLVLAWLGLSILILSYNNCGKQFSSVQGAASTVGSAASAGTGTDAVLVGSGNLCEDDLLRLFSRGYHKFLIENCSTCHAQGPGKGRFSNTDINIALADFNQIGYSKVSSNATSLSHNPPYSGPQHTQIINEVRLEWQKGQEDYARCKGTAPVDTTVPVEDLITYELKSQVVPAMNFGEEREMSWNVNQNIFRINGSGDLPNLPSAIFSVKVSKHKTGGGDEYYSLWFPTLHASQVDAHVKGLHVKINGMLLKNPTTFRYVDKDIRAGSGNDTTGLLTTGALVVPGVTSAADTISIVIEDLKVVTLPPPQPPITANFSLGVAQWSPKTGDRIVNVEVVLSQAPVDPVSLSVIEDSSKICNANEPVDLATAGCLPEVASLICPTADATCRANNLKLRRARSVVGTTYNRFDWDYKFQNANLIFFPGETKKTIQVRFSKDIRKEDNRLLSLKLESGLGAVVGGNNIKHFVIEKLSNPTPPIGVARFQDLMHPTNGILAVNCMQCHNSTKREGQYDISNYDEMVERGVLVPGSTASKMFRRINPMDPDWANLQPMPRTGAMEDAYIRAVQKWIEAGAPNN